MPKSGVFIEFHAAALASELRATPFLEKTDQRPAFERGNATFL